MEAVEYEDEGGFTHTLTLHAATANEAVSRMRAALKVLKGMGARPAQKAVGTISLSKIGQKAEATDDQTAPVCAIHKTPMQKVQGKKGSFWSCHVKLDDGSWCPYKPAS